MNRSSLLLGTTLLVFLLASPIALSSPVREITNIVMIPPSPEIMGRGENVDITCDYQTDVPEGVQILFRPYTDGSPSPNASTHNSVIHPVGSGSATGWFRINFGSVTVDSVVAQMWDVSLSFLLFEEFVPVTYYYGPTPVTNIVLDPASPANLDFGQTVSIAFEYETAEPGGVLISARPFTMGSPSPNHVISESPVYPVGTGSGTADFRIEAPLSTPASVLHDALATVIVDQISFQMKASRTEELIAEFLVPVSYTYNQAATVEAATWGKIKDRFAPQ